MSDNRLCLTQTFSVSVNRLFDFMSKPEYLQQWLSPDDAIELQVLQHEFRPGGCYRLRYIIPDSGNAEVEGEFIEIRRPELIAFTWIWQKPDIHADIPTRVTWRLQQLDTGSELTVEHEQIPHGEYMQRHRDGWLGAMTRLNRTIERG